jgi:hypothetical protein
MASGIPTQVLKQAEEAERLYQEQIDEVIGPTLEVAPTGATGEVKEPATIEEPVHEEETSEQKAEKAQHKYDVLQGKYNKEVPDLANRLAEQAGMIKLLQDQIVTLTAVKPTDGVPDKAPAKGILDGLEKDPNISYLKEEYPQVWQGIEVALNRMATETSERIKEIKSEVSDQKRHSAKTDRDRFYEEMDKVEGWEEINKSSEFNTWLDEVEPLTGYKRRDILGEAHASLDATRAKNFFSEFSKKTAPVVKEVVEDHKEDLGIAPRTTGGKPRVDKTEKRGKTFKASEYKKFGQDIINGLYKGKEAERLVKEAEYDLAIAENRILLGQ